ncbi:MAG: DUF5665 domain-containing protein [Candidatus Curtissbacteria bacterium]|nr:DUF5665 domain-containing protein [Candidatus Curtissbacteria bacterium]
MSEESNKKIEEPEQSQKVVEKHYIEVNPSAKIKFINGLVGGLGWGIGITVGTALFIWIITFIISRVDIVPIFGQFLSDVIKSSQDNLKTR